YAWRLLPALREQGRTLHRGLRAGLEELNHKLLVAIERAPRGGELKALIDYYLDIGHADDIAGGCPVAALATDIARRSPKARADFLRLLTDHVARLAKYIPGATERERERKAQLLFSGMAGTLTLARVIVDDQQRQGFLEVAKKFYFDAVRA